MTPEERAEKELAEVVVAIARRERITQKEAATYYAALILAKNETWTELNDAIKCRWSVSGLKRIKTMAWKIALQDHMRKGV